ncbi:MAG: L,D-transpeptidase [Anaerolineae bacterium]|nr:L,D-transpeptidase [Anaerolineae bacterium]
MTSHSLSRRRFIKTAGLGTAALLMARGGQALAHPSMQEPGEEPFSYNELFGYPPFFGRVHGAAWLRIFKEPRASGGSVRTVYSGNVIPLYRGVRGEPYDARAWSDVWFETQEGYIHSAYVVPCHEIFNEPVDDVGKGFWGEITVPTCWQYKFPKMDTNYYDFYHYRGFWQQVYKVLERAVDDKGQVWYRIDDEEENTPPRVRQAWILARNIRPIHPDEFSPISPDVEDKRIEIILDKQLVACFEDDKPVFQTRIASGTSIVGDDGALHDFITPYGDYIVERKRPARRMRGGTEEAGTLYDVNAVPWITYFVGTGAAIHGAYWHNNFGMPRSHGCINVTPDAGKWIYRWSQPYVTDLDEYHWTEKGEIATPVIVR